MRLTQQKDKMKRAHILSFGFCWHVMCSIWDIMTATEHSIIIYWQQTHTLTFCVLFLLLFRHFGWCVTSWRQVMLTAVRARRLQPRQCFKYYTVANVRLLLRFHIHKTRISWNVLFWIQATDEFVLLHFISFLCFMYLVHFIVNQQH